LFRRLFGGGQSGVRKAVVIALIGVAVYTILVGADAAVVRVAIMGGTAGIWGGLHQLPTKDAIVDSWFDPKEARLGISKIDKL
jgi:hypothetical protein